MDVFGDSSLFDEFEKEREPSGSFILYERKEGGDEDRSKIIFQIGDSDGSESSSENESSDEEVERSFASNSMQSQEKEEGDGDHEETDLSTDIPNGILRNTKITKSSEKQTEYKLLHERNKYQRYARVIDSTRHVPDEDSPGCQIIFQNNTFSRKYRAMIEQYIIHLISRENQRQHHLPELNLKPSSLTCVDLNNKLSASQRTNEMWSAHSIIGCSQFHKSFVVDTLGWPLVRNQPALTDSWELPKYEQIYTAPLPVSEDDDDGPGKPPSRPKATCFNCGGDHMMTDCPQPRDFNKIRENRDKFREQSTSLQRQGSQRYHKDPEAQPELNKFRPGHISEELRKALGLNEDQLPSYIYNMRIIGYPPGWLEEARVQSSGLSLFDKHGREVDVSGESMEDGEVEFKPYQGEINPEKIIEYPGFTVHCPKHISDEHESLGKPSIQEHQLKSTLCSQMASKKRKAEEEAEQIQKRVKLSHKDHTQDMELEDDDDKNTSFRKESFIPPLPVDTPPHRPPEPEGTPPITPDMQRQRPKFSLPGQPPLPIETPPGRPPLPDNTPPPTPEFDKMMKNPVNRQVSEVSSKSVRSDSPSLEDLEQQYKLLQERLAEDENTEVVELQIVDSCEAELDDSTQDSNSTDILPPCGIQRVGSATSINTFGELGTGSPSSSLPGTPIIVSGSVTPNTSFSNLNYLKTGSVSISKDYGTPIAHRAGVAESLPEAKNFGVGIEDHIPYENLPEATGTFDKMRGLIDKIRGKLKKKNS